MELSSPKKLLIKLFYTLNKTPLEEIGCLSNLYYFFIRLFKITPSKNTFSKLFSQKIIDLIALIYSSSDLSE